MMMNILNCISSKNENDISNIETSEEFSDVMVYASSRLLRGGSIVIAVILLSVLIGCCLIKFPQTHDAKIIITTEIPPVDLLSRKDGIIDKFYVKDKQNVYPGMKIAVIHSTANYDDVFNLNDSLMFTKDIEAAELVTKRWIYKNYNLGEIQEAFESFRVLCSDYAHFLEINQYDKKNKLLYEQICVKKRYKDVLEKRKMYVTEDACFQDSDLKRDETLYNHGLISKSDYESSIIIKNKYEQNRLSSDAEIILTDFEILKLNQEVVESSILYKNEIAEYERLLHQSKIKLFNALEQWMYNYTAISPVFGEISLVNYWSDKQYVKNGDLIASILPKKNNDIIGRMNVASTNLGKIKVGQVVNVRLNGYPFLEYGTIKGIVRNISSISDNNGYVVEVIFPKGLYTSYNKRINLIQRMEGVGQIITDDRRLIEVFVNPIKELLYR